MSGKIQIYHFKLQLLLEYDLLVNLIVSFTNWLYPHYWVDSKIHSDYFKVSIEILVLQLALYSNFYYVLINSFPEYQVDIS